MSCPVTGCAEAHRSFAEHAADRARVATARRRAVARVPRAERTSAHCCHECAYRICPHERSANDQMMLGVAADLARLEQ